MQLRQNAGRRPQLTFTSDFHQLLTGDLIAGSCVLRYDPLRLVSGEAQHEPSQVRVFMHFYPCGGTWEGSMPVPTNVPFGLLADPSAQHVMLETVFPLPPGCNELEIWFSCTHADGHTHWDSAQGRNYWLRFPLNDLQPPKAKIVSPKNKNTGQDTLQLEVDSTAAVESITLRWRLTNIVDFPRQETPLISQTGKAGRKHWTPPEGVIPVPKAATIVFDLVYYVAGRKYTDDNQGRWYLAD